MCCCVCLRLWLRAFLAYVLRVMLVCVLLSSKDLQMVASCMSFITVCPSLSLLSPLVCVLVPGGGGVRVCVRACVLAHL